MHRFRTTLYLLIVFTVSQMRLGLGVFVTDNPGLGTLSIVPQCLLILGKHCSVHATGPTFIFLSDAAVGLVAFSSVLNFGIWSLNTCPQSNHNFPTDPGKADPTDPPRRHRREAHEGLARTGPSDSGSAVEHTSGHSAANPVRPPLPSRTANTASSMSHRSYGRKLVTA